MARTPVVTVLLPHFRAEQFVGQAVTSILDQRNVDFELWIIDDCSTGTAWLEALGDAATDPRVAIFQTSQNVGHYRIKNAAIIRTRSPYIAFQDADDYSAPTRLARQLAEIERTGAALVGCGFHAIAEDGRSLSARLMPRYANLWRSLGKRTILHSPTSFFRRQLFDRIGGFDGTARVAADDDFTLRAAEVARIRNVRECLYYYRQHPASLTAGAVTGFGSPLRIDYARRLHARHPRWTPLYRVARARGTPVPGNDVPFELTRVLHYVPPTVPR